jgi:hypothetical protein
VRGCLSAPACGALLALLLAAAPGPALAQNEAAVAFSLASSEVFTTRARPFVWLTFQQVGELHFRVYRVEDAERFFLDLADPHRLGSPEPYVPAEPTWIERLAAWKARQRGALRAFLRGQLSPAYRGARSAARDRTRLEQRRTVGYTRFAQVPLLNPARVVATWRELLPRVRDAEVRRIPLDLPGEGLYLVEAVHDRLRAYTIVAVSDAGLLVKSAAGQLVTFAVDRASGEPRPGCQVSAIASRRLLARGMSSDKGLYEAEVETTGDPVVTLARCGTAIVPADAGGYFVRRQRTDLAAYIYTDRPVYRPGHTVHVKAILRWRERGEVRPFDRSEVEIVVSDDNGKVVAREQRVADGFGAVWTSFTLPAAAALGSYTITLRAGDHEASGYFSVQEYRKPEFEVDVSAPSPLALQGTTLQTRVRARYYFGQPVAGGSVRYVLFRSPYYSPYRWAEAGEVEAGTPYFFGGDQFAEGTVRLDAAGTATIPVTLPVDADHDDLAVRIEARVTDASGREVSGGLNIIAPWASFLLALQTDRYLYQPGSTATIRVRALDYSGRPQPSLPVHLSLERVIYTRGDPQYARVRETSVTTDAGGRAAWTTPVPDEAGDYVVVATADSSGRDVTARVHLWVPSPTEMAAGSQDQTLELVADRAEYAPGDTARLSVRNGSLGGAVLVTKECEITSWYDVVRPNAGGVLEVPVTEDDVGGVWVNVTFVRDDAVYRAERRLEVPPAAKRIQVAVEPAVPVARPQDPVVLTIRTTDASGQPVPAQVSVAVVDEALFGVQPDRTPDPVDFFYRRRYSLVETQFSREYGFVGYSGQEALNLAQRRRPLTLAEFKAERPERAEVRREFPDAILWVADAATGPDGTAAVPVRFPDALTTWRATARAVTPDSRAGAGVGRVTVTKDVILRLATPRFLTEGDTLDLPVVAHNYHGEGRELSVSVRAEGLTPLDAPAAPLRAETPAGGEHRSTWRFRAERAGTARLAGELTARDDADRLELSLPVLPFGLRREAGVSGSMRTAGEARVTLTVPAESNPAGRVIEVALAPSLAGSLLGALDFLATYPYGCTEQTLSSFLPNLAVLRALERIGTAPAGRLAHVDRLAAEGLRRLLDFQHADGGWGWWKADRTHPFMTAYALYGLLESRRLGLAVAPARIAGAVNATARLYAAYPRAVPDLRAYLAYVLALASSRGVDPDPDTEWNQRDALDALERESRRLSPYGLALLVLALDAARDPRAEALAGALAARAETRGELAWWPLRRDPLLAFPDEDLAGEGFEELAPYFDATADATAAAVQALAARRPGDPLLERAVRWLLANRSAGSYWGTTKTTAMALYALLALMEARREAPATFTVDVTVGGELVGSHTFTPEAWTRADPIVFSAPARPGANEVAVVARQPGPLYWHATARYLETRQPIEVTGSRQLALSRRYFALEPVRLGDRIVYRETPFAGRAAPGDILLVRLTAAGSRDWRYLVIDDPIPAGTEAMATTNAYPLERQAPGWWWTGSHREYRDSRVVVFQDRFDRGTYEFQYLLRVVTPGIFTAPPAQIAPMYVPGVSASTGAVTVTIAERAEGSR